MAGVEATEELRVRVLGALDESALPLLTSATEKGNVVLDLSGVTDADERAVRLLARLPAGQCSFVGCPRWLAREVERMQIDLACGVW
jgi:anti-anti-sigma regulatory factor